MPIDYYGADAKASTFTQLEMKRVGSGLVRGATVPMMVTVRTRMLTGAGSCASMIAEPRIEACPIDSVGAAGEG